jgi:hypothetical protein
MKAELNLLDNSKSTALSQQEAQRKLDEVRMRYGIHFRAPDIPPVVDKSRALKRLANQQRRPTLSVTGSTSVQNDQAEFRPALKRQTVGLPDGSPSENQSFHFLVRIAECTSLLHCEVKAKGNAAAKEGGVDPEFGRLAGAFARGTRQSFEDDQRFLRFSRNQQSVPSNHWSRIGAASDTGLPRPRRLPPGGPRNDGGTRRMLEKPRAPRDECLATEVM